MYSRYNGNNFLLIFLKFDTKLISELAWTKFFGQKSPIMYIPVLRGFPVRFSFWGLKEFFCRKFPLSPLTR